MAQVPDHCSEDEHGDAIQSTTLTQYLPDMPEEEIIYVGRVTEINNRYSLGMRDSSYISGHRDRQAYFFVETIRFIV